MGSIMPQRWFWVVSAAVLLLADFESLAFSTCPVCRLTTTRVGKASLSARSQPRSPVLYLAKEEEEELDEATDADADETKSVENDKIKSVNTVDEGESQANSGLLARIRKGIAGGKKMDRASLAALGTSVLLSYGFVSNAFGCVSVSCSWYIASRRSGLSPLAPGQWKAFLAVYAGFFAFLNIIRPARFALSVYLSRYFERAVQSMQKRFNCNKATAVGLVVFFVNFCGSISLMTLGVATASALSGVPIWAGRV